MLRFDRIKHLLTPDQLQDKLVVQVGLGSGGSIVNDHLTMNGVRQWALFDPDVYDDVNLVKHPRPRSQVNQLKTENQKSWILDRNPDAEVDVYNEDVTSSSHFVEVAREADLILCCVDNQEARLFLNSVAVENRIPCVTGSVYRQGFGGEVYSYVPGISGCLDCMGLVATEQKWNMEGSIEPTPEEQEAVYGMNLRDFKASGLSMDIQTIAIIHAKMALDVLLSGSERRFSPLPANWIIFYNRPVADNSLSGFLKSVSFKLRPRRECQCARA